MNLVEQLLKADVKSAEEYQTGIYKSKRLAKVLGVKEETVDITIKELPARRAQDILTYQVKDNGNLDRSKNFDAKLMLLIEGVVEPSLRDKALQEHFGCADAKSLAEKLFRYEVTPISDEIVRLSGLVNEDTEDEVKN